MKGTTIVLACFICFVLGMIVLEAGYEHRRANDNSFCAIVSRHAESVEYNRTSYNCLNSSEDLYVSLSDAGYPTQLIVGYNADTGSWHEWVRFDLETITGEVVSYDGKYQKQQPVDHGYFDRKIDIWNLTVEERQVLLNRGELVLNDGVLWWR